MVQLTRHIMVWFGLFLIGSGWVRLMKLRVHTRTMVSVKRAVREDRLDTELQRGSVHVCLGVYTSRQYQKRVLLVVSSLNHSSTTRLAPNMSHLRVQPRLDLLFGCQYSANNQAILSCSLSLSLSIQIHFAGSEFRMQRVLQMRPAKVFT